MEQKYYKIHNTDLYIIEDFIGEIDIQEVIEDVEETVAPHFLEGIETRVKETGDMEEWFQNKLTKAHDYLKTLYAYGKGVDYGGLNDKDVWDAGKIRAVRRRIEAMAISVGLVILGSWYLCRGQPRTRRLGSRCLIGEDLWKLNSYKLSYALSPLLAIKINSRVDKSANMYRFCTIFGYLPAYGGA